MVNIQNFDDHIKLSKSDFKKKSIDRNYNEPEFKMS